VVTSAIVRTHHRSVSLSPRRLLVSCLLAVTACASPASDGDVVTPSTELAAPGTVVDEPHEEELVSPPMAEPAPAPLLPSGRQLLPELLRPTSVVAFEPFAPTPGTAHSDFLAWTELLRERFYDQPEEARVDEIRQALSSVHVVDLTPCYFNLVVGLDMAVPGDVEVAAALTSTWYLHQVRYTSVVLPADDPTDVRPAMAESRLMVIDAWRRWWERTLSDPARVDRYRKRIDETIWELNRVGRPPQIP
jgi:hypothetical protein